MSDAIRPTIIADRLYGITLRPQELSLYGEDVRFEVHYSPIFEDPEELATQHFKLLVLTAAVIIPEHIPLELGPDRRLEVIRCGWELELESSRPARATDLQEAPDEIEHLLAQVADTVNELARRAGLEVPMGTEVVSQLVEYYRREQ